MNKKEYTNLALTAGLAMGALLVGLNLLMYVSGANGSLIKICSYAGVVAILGWGHIFYGKKAAQLKDVDGAGFSYGEALGFAVQITILAGVIMVFFQILMQNVIDPEYFKRAVDAEFQKQMAGRPMSDAQIESARELMGMMSKWWMQLILGIFGMAIYGLGIGLITSAVVKRKPHL